MDTRHVTIEFAGPVEQLVVIDDRACGRERLAGRACVDVVLLVEREVSA